jgi:uncharacterized protein (TIGR03435 family)
MTRRTTALEGVFAFAVLSSAAWAQIQEKRPEFEVASVRENKSGRPAYSNFPLNSGSQFDTKGGLLIARDTLLLQYLVFAYKPDMFQIGEFRSKLPDWAKTARFDVEARAIGSPTKDDMRLMMQSLLEERFHLRLHRETRFEPAYLVVLDKPGKTGPQLTAHPADDPICAKTVFPHTLGGAYPIACGADGQIAPDTPGDFAAAGYNVTMEWIAMSLGGAANITDRRVIDQTGLPGTFDFKIEYFPEPAQPDAPADAVPVGPSFTEALKKQLGLKIVSEKRPTEVIVIDRLERPTAN